MTFSKIVFNHRYMKSFVFWVSFSQLLTFIRVIYAFLFENSFLSVISLGGLCQNISQSWSNLWKTRLSRSFLVKMVHLRYILTSKVKVLYWNYDYIYTQSNLLLFFHTCLDNFMSLWSSTFASFRVKFFVARVDLFCLPTVIMKSSA